MGGGAGTDLGHKDQRGGSARRNQEVIDRFQMGKEEAGGGCNEGAHQMGMTSEEDGRRRKGSTERLNERMQVNDRRGVNKMRKAIRAAEPNPWLENNMVL